MWKALGLCVLLAVVAVPSFAADGQANSEDLTFPSAYAPGPAHQALPVAPQSMEEKERREFNRYRLREWRRILHDSPDRDAREQALACMQTIGSDIGYWRVEDDPGCELPWLIGHK